VLPDSDCAARAVVVVSYKLMMIVTVRLKWSDMSTSVSHCYPPHWLQLHYKKKNILIIMFQCCNCWMVQHHTSCRPLSCVITLRVVLTSDDSIYRNIDISFSVSIYRIVSSKKDINFFDISRIMYYGMYFFDISQYFYFHNTFGIIWIGISTWCIFTPTV